MPSRHLRIHMALALIAVMAAGCDRGNEQARSQQHSDDGTTMSVGDAKAGPAAPAPVPAQDSEPRGPFGAIAVSANGVHAGFSTGKASRKQAEASAVATCESSAKSARSGCATQVWYRDACGALATGDDGAFGTGWGDSRRQACGWALQSCRQHGGRNCEANWYECSPRKLSGTCDGTMTNYK